MGCGSSQLDAQQYLENLKNVVYDQRIEPVINPSQTEISELVEVIVQGFGGDKSHQPELSFQWAFGEHYEDFDSPLRKDQFRFFGSWIVQLTLKYGVVYIIRDPISKEIGGIACMFPPDSVKNGQVETFCRIASVIKEVGVPPSAKDSKKYPGGVMDRMESIGDVMKNGHKKYASMPHWYLYCLCIKPEYQGKGIGKAFLNLMNFFADQDGVPCYLECTGERNTKVYQRFGYQIVNSEYIKNKKNAQEVNQHLSCLMLRPQKQ